MITNALLDEYGLNSVSYLMLALIRQHSQMSWSKLGHLTLFKRISGQPAATLRKLVDRGLITGPARSRPIRSAPFAIAPRGEEILAKIERGLHRSDWLSAGKLAALELLATGFQTDRDLLDASHRMSIISLKDAGYIQRNGEMWHATPLGLEALREHRVFSGKTEDKNG